MAQGPTADGLPFAPTSQQQVDNKRLPPKVALREQTA